MRVSGSTIRKHMLYHEAAATKKGWNHAYKNSAKTTYYRCATILYCLTMNCFYSSNLTLQVVQLECLRCGTIRNKRIHRSPRIIVNTILKQSCTRCGLIQDQLVKRIIRS